MVAFKRRKELYWFSLKPYVQSQRRSSVSFSVECSKVLTIGYARRIKKDRRVVIYELDDLEILGGLSKLPLYRVWG
jgi:hypothetical protein